MIIKVKVNTNSKNISVEKSGENSFIVKFKAQREKGKANLELINILSQYFKVQRVNVKIISGHNQNSKIIEIKND